MARAPQLMEMLEGLIATPSVSSVSPEFDQSNRPVIELLAGWLEDAGFAVEIQPLPEQPHKANLIATLGRGDGGLVLSGHTDTVPFDADDWHSDPFRLSEREGRLYGLGTADMKSFLGLAIHAARDLDTTRLQQPLIIVATADEESSMQGATALVRAGRPRGRAAVIGEPTGLTPIRAHKGIMMEALRITGHAGHSSDPRLGHSALEGMSRALQALLELRAQLQARYRDPLFEVPYPTLNLGHIHGGDNPNRICGHCELHFDLRPLPGMQPDELRSTIREHLNKLFADSPLQMELVSLVPGTPPMATPAQAEIVRLAEELTERPAAAAAYCTEAPYLSELGLQTIVLGPGNIDQAHQPDEFLAVDFIEPTVNILKRLIHHYCLSNTSH